MSKEMLKNLIDMLDDKDIEIIYKVLVRFVPDDVALPDEVEALMIAEDSISKYGTISHDKIDWN